jgi:signal transduction histidine kinase/ligand-binding sensor domain-containing protein
VKSQVLSRLRLHDNRPKGSRSGFARAFLNGPEHVPNLFRSSIWAGVRGFHYRWGIILALLLAAPIASMSLDPSVAPTQYVRQHWGRAEGIPDISVFAITQTRDGYLWVGTEMGLVRFDGARFTLFGVRNTPAFETSMVTSLLETRDGALLIGTRTGVIEYTRGAFRRLQRPGGAQEAIVGQLFEDGAGRIWVGSLGDLGFFERGKYQVFTGPKGERLHGAVRVGATPDGALWFLDGPHVYRWKGGHLDTVVLPDVSQALIAGRSGHLWAFPPGRVFPLAGTASEPVDRAVLGARSVISALEDRDGSLWLGTPSGFFRCLHGRLESVDHMLGGPQSVNALFEDREGNLWIGTMAQGLYCISPPLVTSYGQPEGLDLGYVNTLLESWDGSLWIATQNKGLVRWKGGVSTHFGEKDGLPHPEIASLLEDSKGQLWVGTPGGLARFDGKGRFLPVPLPAKGPPVVFSLGELRDGSVLAGTTAGILALRDGLWGVIEPPQGNGCAFAIEPDGMQGAWLATLGRGLFRWDGRKMKAFGASEGVPSSDLIAFHTDGRGRLWIGTANRGLVVLDRKRFRTIGPAEGLPEGPVYMVLEAAGSLWLSGNAGIIRLKMADIEAWLAGRDALVHPLSYGELDGMRRAECNGGYQPAGWKARDGRLWFPTVDGIVRVDPAVLDRAAPCLSALLEETLVDGEPASVSDGALRLPPGRERLEVHFTAPAFPSAQGVRFEYRLEGFDRNWVSAGPRRVAYYTNIPPGKYLFKVRASARGGPWAESGETLRVVKPPRFWQTWAFLLACVVAVALFAFGLHRLRVLALRRRFEAVLEERNRISREIHDSLTQSFAGVVMSLEAAERARASGRESGQERILQAKTMARSGLEEARRFVRGLRPMQMESEDLVSAMERVTRAATSEGSCSATFRAEGRKRALPPAVEDHLLRITQESLANAVRHSGASSILVILALSRSEVVLTIEDDGKGFDPSAVVTHAGGGFGLKGMRERTQEMKGTFELDTAPGKGTRIAVRVPA